MFAHPIIPPVLASNPGVHGAAIGAIVATLSGALPAIAAIMPIIYYGLLILDHVIEKYHPKHKRRK